MVCKKLKRSCSSGNKYIPPIGQYFVDWSIDSAVVTSFLLQFQAGVITSQKNNETFHFPWTYSGRCLANIALRHWPSGLFAVALNVRKRGNLTVAFTSAYEIRSNTLGNGLNNAASAVTRCCTAAFGVSSDTSSYTLLKITVSSHTHCRIMLTKEYTNHTFYLLFLL